MAWFTLIFIVVAAVAGVCQVSGLEPVFSQALFSFSLLGATVSVLMGVFIEEDREHEAKLRGFR
jgi:hypothetical protein